MSSSPVRFGHISLVVTDMAASRAFYARLGLDFGNVPQTEWDHHHVSAVTPAGEGSSLAFDLDSAVFASEWNQGWPGGPGAVLGFSVPTRQAVDDLVADLAAAGSAVQQEPWDAFWGARYAVVSDPDGNAVGIMSPIDDAFRSDHPPPA